eukprot:TRINITY_DN890_c0_g1_i1.p1 TRINITY_DN890_c0_g1~~TRINITY_DN890_c0_g1_i1.p1  ORF type:complete len:615 (+),score=254.76 TRINITY_DN890_c0_g1_i1:65-1909(+)
MAHSGGRSTLALLLALMALVFLMSLVLAEDAAAHDHAQDDAQAAKAAKLHKFTPADRIPFFANKIGPFSNPSETYPYYSLPFCALNPNEVQHRHVSLGESLSGNARSQSLYDIRFNIDIHWQQLCKIHINKEEIEHFKKAIDQYYFFEFLFDELPIKGFIGTVDRLGFVDGETKPRYYLFKHLHFEILRNGDQVIYANVSSDLRQLQELTDQDELMIEFSYSAKWSDTDIPFNKRKEIHNEFSLPHEMEVHWLSIMNSFVLVILLTGFITIIILRIIKRDITRYQAEDEDSGAEEYGWKLIHGDVFRFPSNVGLLSALLGVGAQFTIMSFLVLAVALISSFGSGHSISLYSTAIFLYALTAVIAGLVSSMFYRQLGGEKWVWNIVLTATLYAVPFFIVAMVVNGVAMSYHTTSAVPVATIVIILAIWALIGFPLTVFGGIAGRHLAGPLVTPCRTKHFPRVIPSAPWFRQAPMQMIMAGFLPFSAIYIELYYIYSSLWGHNSYTLFGILMLVFVLLLIVTACITIALTYFQLSMEDHQWWWRSFLSGGSTGIFIYAYSFFYYYYRSKMSGTLQAFFYFGYMFILCLYFFIMLGSVGFYSSFMFIRKIYEHLHVN